MKGSITVRRLLGAILLISVLACSPATRSEFTPTPTKTPRPLPTLAEVVASPTTFIIPTPAPVEPTATESPVPITEPPTDTPVPVDEPPTATPEPEQPPTDTPLPPPPPPTNTPAPPPPPPTDTPVPAPPPENTPVPVPASDNSPTNVVIDLPDGDSYGIGDEIEIRITVSDADGVAAFSWGILSAINQGLAGGNEDCGNAPQCSTEASFTAVLSGDFQIGVEVKDAKGEGTIRTSQLYVR